MSRRRRRTVLDGDDPKWTENIKGVDVEIEVDRGDGNFRASFAGEWFREETKAALVAKIERLIKKTAKEVSIPVTMIDVVKFEPKSTFGGGSKVRWIEGIGVRHLTLRKIHLGTGAVLAVDEDGAKEQVDRWGKENLVRRLSGDEVAEYESLARTAKKAATAFQSFVEKRKIKDPQKLVERKLREAADEEDDVDDESGDPRV